MYVGFLRDDALIVHLFRYQRGEWTALADSVEVPREWTVYGYDRSVRPLQVGAVQIIPDDEYDYWGRRTDYPADSIEPNVRPQTRVGIATTAPGKPYLLFPVDSGSAEWKDVAEAAWSAFVGREQRAVDDLLEQEVCNRFPPGVDCIATEDRRRLKEIGRLPRGHPIDSAQRARGKVVEFGIQGTGPLPGGLTLYHVTFNRWYPALKPGEYCGLVSYFNAKVVRRGARLAVTNAELWLSDCDGRDTRGETPHGAFLLGGRVFVIAHKWALHEHESVVRELTDAGLVKVGDPGIRER